jgi:hypothetical protein
MLSKVNLKLVTTEREREEVKAFGLTLNPQHELEDRHFMHPIFIARNSDQKIIGFYQIKMVPLVLSAWSKEESAIDMIAGINYAKSWDDIQSQISGRDNGYVGVNLNHETFTPSTMKKLGFDRVGIELYQVEK